MANAADVTEPETSKITSVTKTDVFGEKIKDPKRVAAGKRLAQISKEAKERKARERLAIERETNCWRPMSDYNNLIGIVGIAEIIIGIIGIYLIYTMRKEKKVQQEDHPNYFPEIPEQPEKISRRNSLPGDANASTVLDRFDE